MHTIREPQQKRAIDKKNRIIEAGYILFEQHGYYNTNTTQIAHAAGVSIGALYGYFPDKKAILLEVIDMYIEKVYGAFYPLIVQFSLPDQMDALFSAVLNKSVEVHRDNQTMHEYLHALEYADKDVNAKFMSLEQLATKEIAALLIQSGYAKDGVYERVHWAMSAMQSFAHEQVYGNHDYIDYAIMQDIGVNVLKAIFA